MNNHSYSLHEIPPVVSVDDLMDILHIGRNTAYNLVRAGTIRSIRIGKQIRIPREAVLQFLTRESA